MNPYPTLGAIHAAHSDFESLIDTQTPIERLATGLTWSEGPVWDRRHEWLLFSDIPRNAIYRWNEQDGLRPFMYPSGYTGVAWYGAEPGSNALAFDSEGRLTACEHGDRRVSRLEHSGGKKTLVDSFEGKRLNSPNDCVYRSDGGLYFTDPAYGLPGRYDDPGRELPFCGVYLVRPTGEIVLLINDLEFPNGLAFSPDQSILYVSHSNPDDASWRAYPVRPDGAVDPGEVIFDVTEWTSSRPGITDGFKLDRDGNLWGSGPGGVYVFTPGGRLLGWIETGERTSNCAWGDDGSTLYITAHMHLLRVRTRTRGAGW